MGRSSSSFGVNLGQRIVTDGEFVARERRALPKLLWEDLFFVEFKMTYFVDILAVMSAALEWFRLPLPRQRSGAFGVL